MAIVKVYFRKSAQKVLNYVLSERSPNDVTDAHGCTPENAANDFKTTAQLFPKKSPNECLHIIQSWNQEESQLLSPEHFNKMGMEMIAKSFPGHEYVIVTHTDTGRFHNHIVVNTTNYKTGKRIKNKKSHLYQLRKTSDEICKTRGLSVVLPRSQEKPPNLPDKVLRMDQFKNKSYLMDTLSKADFARFYATNFDEYVGILSELNIPVRIEQENITYFYPGKERGKRGSKLGLKYDKAGLIETFKTNNEKFKAHPQLRLLNENKLKQFATNPEGLSKNDYTTFTRIPRREYSPSTITEARLADTLIPIEEIRKARRSNIFDYCRREKIDLTSTNHGKTILKGREHVEVQEFQWTNNKNKTVGSLIEFVAAHRNTSLLRAISTINQNPRLLLLEETLGEQKRTYQPFSVPMLNSLDWKDSSNRLTLFLKSFGVAPELSRDLLRRNQAKVSLSGTIHLFSEGEHHGSMEWTEDQEGRWQKQKHGQFRKPFFSRPGSGPEATVFLDPLNFLKTHGKSAFSGLKRAEGLLVLLEPDPILVHSFVSQNKQIKALHFVRSSEKQTNEEVQWIDWFKEKYKPLGIEVALFSHEQFHHLNRTPSIDLSM